MAKSEQYWQKRSLERLTRAERSSVPYLKQIQKIYRNSARSVVRTVKEMYASYYRNDNTFSQDMLEEIEPNGNITRFMNDMAKAGLKTELPENFKGRMSRLKMIEAQLWAESKKAAQKERSISTTLYKNTITEPYYRTIFDISKGTGSTPAFSTLSTRTINTILNTRFEGQNYSERIWGNSDKLANSLQEIMARAIATGQSPERTIYEVMERFGVARSNAARLVRTETNYFENRSELESYKELGIEEFQFLATLDERTSDICRSMDHKKFKVKDAEQGKNVPPLHPYCRSTIAPVVEGWEPDERSARNPEGETYITSNQSYSEWIKEVEQATSAKLSIKRDTVDGVLNSMKGKTLDRITRKEIDILADDFDKNYYDPQSGHGLVYDVNRTWNEKKFQVGNYVQEKVGYDKQYPVVVERVKFDAMNGLKIKNTDKIYRGWHAINEKQLKKFVDGFKKGKIRNDYNAYGYGQYFTKSSSMADSYASGPSTVLTEAKIMPGARVLKIANSFSAYHKAISDLSKQLGLDKKALSSAATNLVLSNDLGALAALCGYDIIDMSGALQEIVIVLNRGKIVIPNA